MVGVLSLLLVLAVVVVSALWYQTSRHAVQQGIEDLQTEISLRIEDHLDRFLSVPHGILEANAAVFRVVDIQALGVDGIRSLLLDQIKIFESVSSIYVGSTLGGIVDAGREGPDGLLYTIETAGFQSGAFEKYRVAEDGTRIEQLDALPDFDARTRPWYVAAEEAGGPTWTDIYVLFSGQDMAIAAANPVYDESGNLLVVLGSDIFLSQIGDFMQSLDYGEEGVGFIVGLSGLLVASSTTAPPLQPTSEGGGGRRVLARDCQSPLIREATTYLEDTYGAFSELTTEIQDTFFVDGKRHFVLVRPIHDEFGINWLAVLVIPESGFLGPLRAGTRTTLVILAVALALVLAAGTSLAEGFAARIEHLTSAAHALGEGNLVKMPHTIRTRELRDLSFSFERMGERLQSTLQSLRLVLDKAPTAIFLFDKDGVCIDVNPAACSITGYSCEELLAAGDPHSGIPEERKPDVCSKLLEMGAASGEILIERKDGADLWLQIDAVKLATDQLLAFCQDITERKRTEDTLRHQQKMEALGTMASGVAHEINNPLMGMMSNAELVEGRLEDGENKEHVRSILREGERIAHIIRNLSAFSRGDRGIRQRVDLRAIIRDCLPLVRTAMLRSNVVLSVDLDEAVPEVWCARQQIQQVVVNLLMNARDALDAKYPAYDAEKTVRVSVSRIDQEGASWVRTTIEDHGIGMHKDVASRVFDPFFTTGPRDERTGLGLTVSYGIIQENDGKISLESTSGEGTKVWFDLPAAETGAGETS